jgi:hypothetical protein
MVKLKENNTVAALPLKETSYNQEKSKIALAW